MTDFYDGPEAPDFFGADDPMALFAAWLADAEQNEPNDPNAMSLATIDDKNMPDLRVVLLKHADARGFVFYTNKKSAKGRELAHCPNAALNFHWKSLRRQVRIRGVVAAVTNAEADAYFLSRSKGSRIGAWASQQSAPLDNRTTLEHRVAELEAQYPGKQVPRPAHWSGYRVVAQHIEFWHDRPFRLHDRLLFSRPTTKDPWEKSRLYP